MYHLVWVRYVDYETPILESVPIVNKFLEVFLDYLPIISLKWEIDFGIDSLPSMQLILIPPHRITQIEIKELKE